MEPTVALTFERDNAAWRLVHEQRDQQWTVEASDGPRRLIIDTPPFTHSAIDPERILEKFVSGPAAAIDEIPGSFCGVYADAATIILFRDAFGTRPLHWRFDGERLHIATLAADLRRDGDSPNWPFLAARAGFERRCGTACAITGVERVPPGAMAIFGQTTDIVSWWNPKLERLDIGAEEATRTARALLSRAVAHSIADASAPIAVELTGGLDSPLVLATALGQRQPADFVALTGRHEGPTLPPGDRSHLEDAERAAAMASVSGVRHELVSGAVASPFPAADEWQAATGEALGSPDNLSWLSPLYATARRHGAQVLLAADHGNFVLSWPGTGAMRELLRSGRWHRLWRTWSAYRQNSGATLAGCLGMTFGGNDGVSDTSPFVAAGGAESWPSTPRAERLALLTEAEPGPAAEYVRRRYGLWETDPFLDRPLVEWSLRLPEHVFFRNGRTRGLAWRLLMGQVPDAVRLDPRRGVQGADWPSRLAAAGEDMTDTLEWANQVDGARRYFDLDALGSAVSTFELGKADELRDRCHLARAVGALRLARTIGAQ